MIKRVLTTTLCLAIASLGLSLAAPAGAATSHTRVSIVKPVDQYGFLKPGWTVLHRLYGGDCHEGSDDGIPGAERCFAGNGVYDPCWPTMNKDNHYNGSFCPSAPWSQVGVLIKGRHHVSDYATGRRTWGIQLASGDRCGFVGGATEVYRGKRLNYACSRTLWLVGRPTTSVQPWRITAIVFKQGRVVRQWTARIGRAWVAVSPYGG